jgi:hypothetical protein
VESLQHVLRRAQLEIVEPPLGEETEPEIETEIDNETEIETKTVYTGVTGDGAAVGGAMPNGTAVDQQHQNQQMQQLYQGIGMHQCSPDNARGTSPAQQQQQCAQPPPPPPVSMAQYDAFGFGEVTLPPY